MPTNGSPIYTPKPVPGAGGGPSPATSVSNSDVGDTAVVGSATRYAREDHEHAREGFGSPAALNTDGSAADGTAVSVSHSDHKHAIPSTLNTNARVAVSRAGALVGTRRGINLIENTGFGWTVADNSGSERVDVTPKIIASDVGSMRANALVVMGHSWTAGANMASYMSYAQNGFTAHLCGLLSIHNDNLMNYGTSGAALSMPVNQGFTATPLNGWAGTLQFITPDNCTMFAASNAPIRADLLYPIPAINVILHGINDVGGTTATQRGFTQNAWAHAMRAVIHRMRAGALYCSKMVSGVVTWDSAISTTGTGWADVSQSLTNTGAGIKASSTNGDTVTFTIPNGYTGGTIGMTFIGQFNAYDTTSGSSPAGATSVTLAKSTNDWASSNVEFPCTVLIGTESIRATAYNSSTGVLTLATALVNTWAAGTTVTVDNTRLAVTWSTNRPSDTIISGTAKTRLAGQGQQGQPVAVTTRFNNLDQSYAGYTITATVADCAASDTSKVKFDSVSIEAATSLPPVLVANIPKMSYVYPYSAYRNYWADFNATTTSVVNEFDAYVAVVDIDTVLRDRDCVLATGIATGAAGSSVSLSVTANTTAFSTTPGYLVGIEGEIFRVNSISGSYPNYTLTCTRGPSGYTAYSTANAHTAGAFIHRIDNMSLDHIHESPRGAGVMAREFVRVLDTMPVQNDAASGLGTSSWTQELFANSIGVGDTDWLQPPMGGTTTLALTQDQPYAIPIFIPRESVIVGAGVVCGAASTGTVRLGLWAPNNYHSLPAQLIADFGTVSPVTANVFYQTPTVYARVRPGWYWVGCQKTTTAGVTLRAIGGANNAPGYQLPLNANPSGTTSIYTGYRGPTAGTAGQFDSTFYNLTALPTLVSGSPIVWLNVRTTGY